jgi:hypothetical protein
VRRLAHSTLLARTLHPFPTNRGAANSDFFRQSLSDISVDMADHSALSTPSMCRALILIGTLAGLRITPAFLESRIADPNPTAAFCLGAFFTRCAVSLMTKIVGLIPAIPLFGASLVAALFSVWWAAAGYTIATYAALVVHRRFMRLSGHRLIR